MASISASSNTIIGALPPSSNPNRFILFAPTAPMVRPVCVLPVKLIVGTSGLSTRSAAPSEPLSMNMFKIPPGRSFASARILARTLAICAAWPGILTTTAQPAASAGAKERTARMTGEFQGTIIPATPIGWRRITERLPGFGNVARPASVRAIAAQYRSLLGLPSISSAASPSSLPFSSERMSIRRSPFRSIADAI
ncbi:hypothetical protein D3C80_1533870 [compost metagenome]